MSKVKRAAQYTAHLHAVRLVEMLEMVEETDISFSCPASIGFQAGKKFLFEKRFNITEDPVESPECRVCKAFVGMPLDTEACPCDHLGDDKAIEITKQKLKDGGYLD